MATLPKTGRAAPRQISTEQLPQVPAPRSRFVPSVQPGVGRGIAEGLSQLSSAAVENLDERERQFFELEQKVERQKVAQIILKGELDFQRQASEKLNALETDGALTKDDFYSVYGQFLDQQIQNQVNDSGLTGVAAELYRTNLEAQKNQIAIQAGLRHKQVMDKQALDVFGWHLNQFNLNRPQSETFAEYVTQLNRYVATKGLDKLTSASQTEAVLRIATGNEFLRRFGDMLTKGGSLVEAEQFLEKHRFDVPPEFVERAESMFSAAEKSQEEISRSIELGYQKAERLYNKPRSEFGFTENFFAMTQKLPPERDNKQTLSEWAAEFKAVLGRDPTEDEIKRKEGLMEKEKEGEDFTLGKDQQRFDAQGNVIASGPKSPEEPTAAELGRMEAEKKAAYMDRLKELGVSDESLKSDLVDESGNLKTEADGELRRQFVLQLGGTVDQNGQVIGLSQEKASLMSNLMAEASRKIRNGEAKSVSEAVNQVRLSQPSGTFKEDLTFRDVAEQRKQEILGLGNQPPEATPQNAEAAMKEFEAEVSAAKTIDLGDATGVVSGVIDSWNTLMGQFSPELENKEVTKARMNLAILGRDFIRLIALNSRFAVAEQELLRAIFPGPSAFNTPEKARIRIRQLDGILDKRIGKYESTLDLPFSQEAKQQALDTLEVLYEMKAAINRFDLSPGGRTTVDITKDTTPEDISKMSSSQVNKFVQNADDETLNSLSIEQQKAIGRKLGIQVEVPNESAGTQAGSGSQSGAPEATESKKPHGAQKFLTAKIMKMIQGWTTKQLQTNLERVKQRDPQTERDKEIQAAFEEVLALRKGKNVTNRKGKKKKKKQAEPKEENSFIGTFKDNDTDTIRATLAFLKNKPTPSKFDKQMMEAAEAELAIRGEDAGN